MQAEQQTALKHGIDALMAGGVVASIVGWLPEIAALLSAVWFLIQIAEKVFGEKIHFTIMRLVNCFKSKKPDA